MSGLLAFPEAPRVIVLELFQKLGALWTIDDH